MIWSVSTLARSSGATRPVWVVKAFIDAVSSGLDQFAHVDEVAGPRGGGGQRRADQVGAATGALAPLEVAVGSGGAVLAAAQLVRVHGQAHRTARLAPLEAGLDEHLVQALGLGLGLDQARARHDQGLLDAGRHLAP